MLRVLDSFAGAGGFSLGFSMTNKCEVVGAIEIDDWAAETFRFNHPQAKVLVGDIQSYSEEALLQEFQLVKPDIILGGPPCQGFSIANRKAGDPTDPRNSLFTEFIRLGKIFSPRIMVLENVPNIVRARTHSGELVISIIKKELEAIGYSVEHMVLNATDYGVPQIRRRLFVVANRGDISRAFPPSTHCIDDSNLHLYETKLKCPTLWDAISDLPDVEARGGAEEMEYDKPAANEYQMSLRSNSQKVYNHTAMKHSRRMVERFASMAWGDSVSDVPDHLKPLRRNGNGETAISVYDQNNRRMEPNKPCHTIAASFYANFVHPFKQRNFTPREGARIQSFPDSYVFKGKPTVVSQKLLHREERFDEKHLGQYNQIGNAVPPLMAMSIAENLIEQL